MSELSVNRKNTKAFIDADPVIVALERRLRQSDGEGGWTRAEEPEPIDPQVFRLIPQSDTMPTIQTVDGFQRTPGFVLLGVYDANMQNGDYFSIDGTEYQIVSPVRPLHTERAYERKGDVALV